MKTYEDRHDSMRVPTQYGETTVSTQGEFVHLRREDLVDLRDTLNYWLKEGT